MIRTPPTRLAARNNANTRIALERLRQIELWGDIPQPMEKRLPVLVEEVGECAKAMCDDEGNVRLLEEVVQVAAVALRWAEDLLLEMEDEETVPEKKPQNEGEAVPGSYPKMTMKEADEAWGFLFPDELDGGPLAKLAIDHGLDLGTSAAWEWLFNYAREQTSD